LPIRLEYVRKNANYFLAFFFFLATFFLAFFAIDPSLEKAASWVTRTRREYLAHAADQWSLETLIQEAFGGREARALEGQVRPCRGLERDYWILT
jgi:hypothetical protein